MARSERRLQSRTRTFDEPEGVVGQLFRRRADTFLRLIVALVIASGGALVFVAIGIRESQYITEAGVARTQPIAFSHEHHVQVLGLDCRFCHSSVEKAASAGMPSTQVCMTCHSQIWTESPMLAEVRKSWETGTPIRWERVHRLPDFVYFHHGIHVSRGVSCVTCHGAVERMPLMSKARDFYMRDCLSCHRDPKAYVPGHFEPGNNRLMDCATCHR